MHFLVDIVEDIIQFFFANSKFSYPKGSIIIDFEDRYQHRSSYIRGKEEHLSSKGRSVEYVGDRTFIIDGKYYEFITQNAPALGKPIQRTLLYTKDDN
ncbi:hypothetical protein GLW08_04300 [Pontibacillus yanchengensis]|uniref:Uncharacterized protein n=2 Tax=Pontibacillus yanchengensis TaxID=462910 RepID=A0ACC7VC53_9BACI|nr:hypothetical protein [Pontibacillus yanchengensis]MYL35077.1 hypothetical protein [Pontibacillus yanchengensis]MYL52556.1 hypothetical protein [Pontibacillus yanchengensis]